jgi:hypothetical protein
VDSFAEGDPAAKRYAQLTDALSVSPTLTAIEIAVLVRLVSWSTADDVLILSRMIRRSRRDAFEVGRTAGRAEQADQVSSTMVEETPEGGES